MREGVRKWSVAVLGVLSSFVLALFGKLTGEFVTVIVTTVTVFSASNAAVHLKGTNGTR